MSTSQTRYIISPSQENFLKRLQEWLINLHYSSLISPDIRTELVGHRKLIIKILINNGYDEEDRFTLNHVRYLYLKDKDTLPL